MAPNTCHDTGLVFYKIEFAGMIIKYHTYMQLVPLDIKIQIAIADYATWIRLMIIDDEFHRFTRSRVGMTLCINTFTSVTDISDRVEYRLFGKLHRDNDLPAIIRADGSQGWYRDGKRHRDDNLPAVIYADGKQMWYRDDKLHRDGDLPAIIWADGSQRWYRDDKPHRDNDLPAVIYADGMQLWYRDDKLHRDNDLPAVIRADGTQSWYRNDIEYTP